jgi:hypothetical protein
MKLKNITAAACSLVAALGGVACDDFLDLTPMNEIVKENFWTEKADVESAVYGCYSGLEATDCVKRMFIFGELRSDNVMQGSSTPWSDQQILKENILESNGWLTWECFYQAINRCNIVLTYAPGVAEIDPNYTDSELKATIAEVTALRALCYFYLIRTYRDVPYVTKPSADDSNVEEDYRVAPTPFKTILANLINDLEVVKGDAIKLYPEDTNKTGDAANTSRVTTCMIYALLADLYLWDEQYERSAYYCDLVLDYKMERYEDLLNDGKADYLFLFRDKYPLYMEQPIGTTAGYAYNQIFGTGNSFESIFELYYLNNQSVTNSLVSDYFGSSSQAQGYVVGADQLATEVYTGNNTLFQPTDCRVAEGWQDRGNFHAIRKYVSSSISFTPSKNNQAPTVSHTIRSTNYANWIVYRLTDILLIKAEADVELGNLDEAFQLVSTVYNRANNFTTASADTLNAADYATQSLMRDLVFNERRRELLFEGKRWFDLVRLSLRLGDNTKLIEAVTTKQKENVSAIKIKLHSEDALFFPYAKRELDVNPHLQQNPAYITNETSSK